MNSRLYRTYCECLHCVWRPAALFTESPQLLASKLYDTSAGDFQASCIPICGAKQLTGIWIKSFPAVYPEVNLKLMQYAILLLSYQKQEQGCIKKALKRQSMGDVSPDRRQETDNGHVEWEFWSKVMGEKYSISLQV